MVEQQTFFDMDEPKKHSRRMKTQERIEDYDGFVEKFKPKKTTDDCYTPELVYNTIADWVANEYGVNKADFVRPFYPGGNYQQLDYSGKIVVDNPPFSILAQIIDFYILHKIKFFLFAPQLTSLKHARKDCTFLCCDCSITYENGAVVKTSFLTNLEPPDICVRTVPELKRLVNKANDENIKVQKAPPLPKYKYPKEVVSIALISTYARHDVPVTIRKSEIEWIEGSALDSQRKSKKAVFGGGFFVSHSLGQRLDEARRQADEARRQADEARRQADEARRQADEARRQADEARRQADEARRQADEARRQADEARSVTWELSEREFEIIERLERRKA